MQDTVAVCELTLAYNLNHTRNRYVGSKVQVVCSELLLERHPYLACHFLAWGDALLEYIWFLCE